MVKNNKIYNYLLEVIRRKKAGFFCLIDSDKQDLQQSAELAKDCEKSGADAIFVGGSIMLKNDFDSTVIAIKKQIKIPIIIFPGIFSLGSPHADAILFMSLLSSRNPQLLIGEQVRAAPLIKKLQVETIPTGYLIIESGSLTSVQYMSNSTPIPRDKNDIAIAHILAAQYLGMKIVFMDAGSGAKMSIPVNMIDAVKKNMDIPLIVGGGIKTPDDARKKVNAGADFVVIGHAFEKNPDKNLIQNFADAIHKG